jgi:hypothetical protein
MLDQLTDLANGVNGSEGEVTLSPAMVHFIRQASADAGSGLRARRIAGVVFVRGVDLVEFVNACHGHEKIKRPAESLPVVEEFDLSGKAEPPPDIEPDGDIIISETADRTRALRRMKGSPGLHNVNPPPNEVADLSDKGSLDVVQADEQLAENRDPDEFEDRLARSRNRQPFPTVSGVPPTAPLSPAVASANPMGRQASPKSRGGKQVTMEEERAVDPNSSEADNLHKPDPNNPPAK